MNDMDNSEGGINPSEAILWAEIATDAAVVAADHRDEGARALADEWAVIATYRATVAMAVAQATIAAAQTRQAMTWERIANLLERALPSMGNALAELAAAATDLDGQSAPALLAWIADTLRDDDNNPIGAGILSLLETIARNTGAIDDDDDDDDDEPSIAEATRIVAAANRYK